MINKLINPSKTDDVLFLSGIVLNIMNEKEEGGEQEILPELFTTLGLEGTINLIKFFGGETIKIPDHETMYKSFLVLICYYKRKIEGKSWEEVKEEVGVELSPHALGKIIKAIDDRVTLEVEELKTMGIEEFLFKHRKEMESVGK